MRTFSFKFRNLVYKHLCNHIYNKWVSLMFISIQYSEWIMPSIALWAAKECQSIGKYALLKTINRQLLWELSITIDHILHTLVEKKFSYMNNRKSYFSTCDNVGYMSTLFNLQIYSGLYQNLNSYSKIKLN